MQVINLLPSLLNHVYHASVPEVISEDGLFGRFVGAILAGETGCELRVRTSNKNFELHRYGNNILIYSASIYRKKSRCSVTESSSSLR